MKKIIYSILAVALLASCSKTVTPEPESDIIVLSAGTTTLVKSKAAIATGGTFTAAVGGWEHATAATYTDASTWESITSTITASATAASITLTPAPSYNADADVKTFIKAWYPSGIPTAGVVTFTNPNASVDVMIADAISGSKTDKGAKTLTFEHKTTQFIFKVKSGAGLAADTKIKKIEIVGTEIPTGINLADNTLNYSAPATFGVPNVAEAVIGATAAAAGDPVMVKTQTGNKLTLNIETSAATYTAVEATIDTDQNFVMGRAYTITLTFGQASIDNISAAVTDWTTGTGSSSVE